MFHTIQLECTRDPSQQTLAWISYLFVNPTAAENSHVPSLVLDIATADPALSVH